MQYRTSSSITYHDFKSMVEIKVNIALQNCSVYDAINVCNGQIIYSLGVNDYKLVDSFPILFDYIRWNFCFSRLHSCLPRTVVVLKS